MSSNNSTIQDIDGDYSDWIELYNTSGSEVNLINYKISDDIDNLSKWVFPSITIQPHSFLLLFASSKDIYDIGELHSNFKISSSGEELFLSNELGELIDQTSLINLANDQSYGRVHDGSDNWSVRTISSPNATNNEYNVLEFSHQAGYYTNDINLIIDASNSDTIYYTLNGDIPTEESDFYTDYILLTCQNSSANVYSEIPTTATQDQIEYKAWESPDELIDKATIIRCASYKNGVLTSDIYSKSFFIDEDIDNKYSIPIISLITEGKNLFDDTLGIFVPGINFSEAEPEWTGNFFMHGDDWERDVHIEYFNIDGSIEFEQNGGIRIHGGKSRGAAQKSLRIYARNKYGKKHFNYKLFPQKEVSKYKSFILRTSMGSWGGNTIIKDILAHEIIRGIDVDHQDFQPVIVYINGEYWGIHTIRDRIDERYISYSHNIDKDSIEFQDPSNLSYNELLEFIETHDLSDTDSYEYVKTKLEIENYISYTIAELFFKNYDWPANNMKIWRKIPDGKWRWIFYDLDAGFGSPSYNMLDHATLDDPDVFWPNSQSSTFLFRNLLKNNEFKEQFIYRYSELLSTIFCSEITSEKLETLREIYSPEVTNHIRRWHYPNSMEEWNNDIEVELAEFLAINPQSTITHIQQFFNIPEFTAKCIKLEESVSDILIFPNPNQGVFFINNTSNENKFNVKIFSLLGQTILEKENLTINTGETYSYNISHLPSNTYILQLTTNNISVKKILILQH